MFEEFYNVSVFEIELECASCMIFSTGILHPVLAYLSNDQLLLNMCTPKI